MVGLAQKSGPRGLPDVLKDLGGAQRSVASVAEEIEARRAMKLTMMGPSQKVLTAAMGHIAKTSCSFDHCVSVVAQQEDFNEPGN